MERLIEKNLHINLIVPGMVASSDIYSYNTNILLYRGGTILTENKINKLKKLGVSSIKVKLKENMTPKKTNEEIVVNKIKLEFDQVIEYANYIVSSVLNNKDVKHMMNKIDSSTYSHSQKVAILSTMVGMHLENFGQQKLEELAVSSLLHDVGKSLIDFSILNKPGKLTDEEYEIIKMHPQKGYDILELTGLFDSKICEAVLAHHENEDGSGYPNNLVEDEIPIYARIIHLCDVYSALTTRRSYKDSWSSDRAFDIMEKDSKKFEPHMLQLLKTSLPIYRKDDVVFLSTNELGTVIKQSGEGTVIKVFGTRNLINISDENVKNNIYVKRKIKVS